MAVMCQGCSEELETWTGKCPKCGHTHQLELRAKTDPMLGKLIGGRYRISRKLGQGGMGAVYLAEHVGVGQKVAVKFLNPNFSGDPDIVRRFLNEAKSYGQIAHPHAVHLHDFGQDEDGSLYISMEYIEGNDLKKQLETGGRLRLKDAVDITLQICDVLGYAHDKGIVHRDLKPENVMLVKGLRGFHAKVLDFGVARLMEEQTTRLTIAGSICGTPRYMSPEQAEGKDVDRRTDIYALGIVLFELVTGRHPFPGNSIAEILRAQVLDPMPHLDAVAPDVRVPDGLDAIIQKATAKDRDQRFATMAELARSLAAAMPTDAYAAFEPNPKDVEGGETLIKSAATMEKTAHGSSPYDRDKKPGRGKGGMIAMVVMAVLLLGTGAAALLAPREAGPSGQGLNESSARTPEVPAGVHPPAGNERTPQPEKAPVPAPTGVDSAVATAELRRVADGSLFGMAQAQFFAGSLDTSVQTLGQIPADSALAAEVAGLKQKIEELQEQMGRASAYYRKGQCDQAVRIYSDVLKKNAGIAAARSAIARCRNEMPAGTIE